ncbi:MAG TPA: hypothetical protein VNQ52_01535 [Microbacteriaceae bacterium]|nr:hypothetical protein [Microbacteriaceae bacterium]
MSARHAYCTFFDVGYLSRAMSLVESLRRHGDDAPVWVLALDGEVASRIAALGIDGIHVIEIAELEAAVPGLAPLKSERSRMEYYFTMTPLLIRHVMRRSEPGTAVAYLDADMWFFDDPGAVWDAMGAGSIGIIEHRYPPAIERRLAKYGRFNVGWVGFAGDERAAACLDWWSASTLEWCGDTPVDGKYADQGYLDQFPGRFDGVAILEPLGMDAAPWNSSRFPWTERAGRPYVGGDPLVFFHFHGVRRLGGWWVTSQLIYRAPIGRVLRDLVYRPYAAALDRWDARLQIAAPPAKRGVGIRGLLFRAQRVVLGVVSVLSGNAVRAKRLSA